MCFDYGDGLRLGLGFNECCAVISEAFAALRMERSFCSEHAKRLDVRMLRVL